MDEWRLEEKDLKRYPHFDPPISAEEAIALATDPQQVAQHKFFPFIRYSQRWTRFAKKGEKGKPKERLIRYAARKDAYIFSYYRHLLSQSYESELLRLGLSENIIAYRKIINPKTGRGKCNIDFALEAFQKIESLENCVIVALDISSYFEYLDHKRIKNLWCRLLDKEKLPEDHFKVFERITKYAVVDKEQAYERLGYFGPKRKTKNGKDINGYLVPYHDMPKCLCTGKDFREKIAGEGDGYSNIIVKNFKDYGIPQGAPLSDVIANFYLIDFDALIASEVEKLGGYYYRYSDDLLFIIPGNGEDGKQFLKYVQNKIQFFGKRLSIKDEKSSIIEYKKEGNCQKARFVAGEKGRNGLEYLGFRYDGRFIYIRDSTLSNLYRKVHYAARRRANKCARRYPDKNLDELKLMFDYEELIQQFGKVKNFEEIQKMDLYQRR